MFDTDKLHTSAFVLKKGPLHPHSYSGPIIVQDCPKICAWGSKSRVGVLNPKSWVGIPTPKIRLSIILQGCTEKTLQALPHKLII